MPILTVTMGCPGSGKTTWARTHQRGAVLLTTDPLRTEARLRAPGATAAFLARLRRKAERALSTGGDAIVDACHVQARDRAVWLRMAYAGVATQLVVFHAPLASLLEVQQARASEGVPEASMRRYLRDFEQALPRVEREGWTRITHVRRGAVDAAPQPKLVSAW